MDSAKLSKIWIPADTNMAEACPSPECLWCQGHYTNPRELPCGHTFYCPCLTTYIQAEHVCTDEDRHYFPCPVCETPIFPPEPSLLVNSWATSFPIDQLLLSSTKRISDDQVCEACRRDGESSMADVWCTDCAETLCKQCRTAHKRNKASAKHRLIPMNDGIGEVQNVIVNEICPNHDGECLAFYCIDHRSMCCRDCVSLSHRNCNTIKPLGDVIRKTVATERSGETEWGEIAYEARKIMEDDGAQIATLDSKETEMSDEINQVIEKAKNRLDDLKSDLQSDLRRKVNIYRQQLNVRLSCVSKFHSNADNARFLMSRLEKDGSDRQLFITREKIKMQMAGHYRRVELSLRRPNAFDVTLKMQSIIDTIMKVTIIGDVDITSTVSLTSQNANKCIDTLLGTLQSTPSSASFADSTSASDLTASLKHLSSAGGRYSRRVGRICLPCYNGRQ